MIPHFKQKQTTFYLDQRHPYPKKVESDTQKLQKLRHIPTLYYWEALKHHHSQPQRGNNPEEERGGEADNPILA